MNRFYLGLDLGQRRDFTAVAVVERVEPVLVRFDYVAWLRRPVPVEAKFAVRHVERFPLGTSYVAIVDRVRRMVRRPELRGHCSLVVDATGGGAVVDLLRTSDLDCELVPVQKTGCGAARKEAGQWNVPKRDLIAVVQALLEQDRLSFALEMPAIRKLLDELMAMRTRVTPEGNSQYGAWREGSHDDLALAVALACWRAKGDERPVGEVASGRLI
jgi:hypothetical protein